MKRTKAILAAILAVILALLAISLLVFKYAEEIVRIKKDLYTYVSELGSRSEQSEPQPEPIDFEDLYSSYPTFVHSEDAWYMKNKLIYHAGGGIDGLSYTNSAEAMQATLQRGNVIELDFRFTKDGQLVCAHEWEDIAGTAEAPTLSEFEALKIYGKYTPMSAADVIDFMLQNEDIYIVIDTKEEDVLEVVRELIRLSENRADIAERFIIQLYEEATKQGFLDLYPFSSENFLFTCYKHGTNPEDIISICMEEDISVVTVLYGTWDAETIRLFTEKGIIIFEHTINRPDFAQNAKARGVYGLYTDFLDAA